MRLTHLFQIDVIAKLHILGVDAQDLKAAGGVRNSDVNLAVETTEATQGRVDRVRPVGGGHYDHVGRLLHAYRVIAPMIITLHHTPVRFAYEYINLCRIHACLGRFGNDLTQELITH